MTRLTVLDVLVLLGPYALSALIGTWAWMEWHR